MGFPSSSRTPAVAAASPSGSKWLIWLLCYNMHVSPHFVMELHLPLVASIPNGLFVEYIPSLDAVLRSPMILEDGYFRPSEEPGLGIPWDLKSLNGIK